MAEQTLYEQRGVSSTKADVHEAIRRLPKGLYPHAFCKIFPDRAGDEAYCEIQHADGVGTKCALAYAYWKETGDMSVWKGIGIDALVMNIDDMLCAGITDEVLYYSMVINLNKRVIPSEVMSAIIGGTQEFIEQLAEMGINIVYVSGETAQTGDITRTISVDGMLAGRMLRSRLVLPSNMQAGDVVVAFSSTGQCVYEKEENGGFGSNGFTSARHELFNKEVGLKYPDSYDEHTEVPELMYRGRYSLTAEVSGIALPLGKAVLSPTRTYAPIFRPYNNADWRSGIHAIIHCSGGGLTKVRSFIPKGLRVVKDNLFPMPPLFRLIQEASGISLAEMYQTFNCGQRMEAYCTPEVAEYLIDIAAHLGIEAKITGRVEVCPDGASELEIVY